MQNFDHKTATFYEKRDLPPKHTLYRTTTYTTRSHAQRPTQYPLPTTSAPLAILHSSVIFQSKNGIKIWNFETNQIEEIEFSSEVTHFSVFQPKKGVLKVEECVIVITQNEVLLYGVNENKFVDTGLTASAPKGIKKVIENKGSVFVVTESDVYEVVYNGMFLRRFYLKRITTGFFCTKSDVIGAACKMHYLAVLHSKKAVIYRNTVKLIEIALNDQLPIGIEIVEATLDSVFFFVVTKKSRIFFLNNSKIIEKPHSLDSLIDYAFENTNFVLFDQISTSLIHFNLDQQINYSAKDCENCENLPVENTKCVILQNSICYVFSTENMNVFEIENYFTVSRPEDAYLFLSLFGPREFLIRKFDLKSRGVDAKLFETTTSSYLNSSQSNYLNVGSSQSFNSNNFLANGQSIGSNYLTSGSNNYLTNNSNSNYLTNNSNSNYLINTSSKINNLTNNQQFSASSIHTLAMFSFVYRLYEPFLFNCANDIPNGPIIKLSALLRSEQSFLLEHVVDALNFVKIYANYKKCTATLYALLFDKTVLQSMLIELSESTRFEELLSTLSLRFLDSEEFISIRASSLLSRGDLKSSLDFYKKLKKGNSIIEKFIKNGCEDGAVELIRRYELTIQEMSDYLNECLSMEKAVRVAMEDHRGWFVSLCVNILICKLDSKKPVNFVLNSTFIFNLNTPFLEEILMEKCKVSENQNEFNLIWKFLIHRGEDEKAAEVIRKIAVTKSLSLSKRIEYFSIADSIKREAPNHALLFQWQSLRRSYFIFLDFLVLSENELLEHLLKIKQIDLALSFLDCFDCVEKSVLLRVWRAAFDNLEIAAISKLRLRNVLRIEILGEALAERDDLFAILFQIGVPSNEIVKHFEKLVRSEVRPSAKKRLVGMFENCGVCGRNVDEVLCGVRKRYGIV